MLYKIKNISRDTINLHGRLIHPKEEIKTAVIEPYRKMLEKGFLKIISEEEQDATMPNIPQILYVNSQRKGETFSKPFAVMNSNINEKLRNRLKDDQLIDTSIPIKSDIRINSSKQINQFKQINQSQPLNISNNKLSLSQINVTDTSLNDVIVIDNAENISTIEDAYQQQYYSNLTDNIVITEDNKSQSDNNKINNTSDDLNQSSFHKDDNNLSDNITKNEIDDSINLPINKKLSLFSEETKNIHNVSKTINKDKRFDALYNKVVKSLNHQIDNNILENISDDLNVTSSYAPEKNTLMKQNDPSFQTNTLQVDTLNDFINIIMQKINDDYYKGFLSNTDNIAIDDLIYSNNQLINNETNNLSQKSQNIIFQDSTTIDDIQDNNQNKILLEEMEQLLDNKLNILLTTQQNIKNNTSTNYFESANMFNTNMDKKNNEIIQSLFHLFIDRTITDDDLQNIKEFYYRIHLLDNVPDNIKNQINMTSSYEELITVLLNTVYPFLLNANNKGKKQ